MSLVVVHSLRCFFSSWLKLMKKNRCTKLGQEPCSNGETKKRRATHEVRFEGFGKQTKKTVDDEIQYTYLLLGHTSNKYGV